MPNSPSDFVSFNLSAEICLTLSPCHPVFDALSLTRNNARAKKKPDGGSVARHNLLLMVEAPEASARTYPHQMRNISICVTLIHDTARRMYRGLPVVR